MKAMNSPSSSSPSTTWLPADQEDDRLGEEREEGEERRVERALAGRRERTASKTASFRPENFCSSSPSCANALTTLTPTMFSSAIGRHVGEPLLDVLQDRVRAPRVDEGDSR